MGITQEADEFDPDTRVVSKYLITSHGEVTDTVTATSPQEALKQHVEELIGDVEDVCNKSPEQWLEDTSGYKVYQLATEGAGGVLAWGQDNLENRL